ncbi:MAG TPA: hypothetical protein DET40_17290 [Lentisphaeria bacterium]|nr:MAG: hypothetical protein A2X45_02715 [Lentisphaerae bacterium GWF2_50_93]HCE45297.1 hypothetical protein [Lentisphaeria bacterium]
MKTSVKTLLALSLLLATASFTLCQEAEKKETEKKKAPVIRFHSGTIMAAEFMPEGFYNPVIANVSRFEPPSRITSDVAFATVTVKLDQGRSLSIYDFILLNKRKDEFKCIGISEGDNRYDAEKWEFSSSKPGKMYTMLFKIQLPAFNDKDEYTLRYMLGKKTEDVLIPFVKINRAFTAVAKIPPEGIIGFDPEPPPPPPPPKPVEEVKAEPAKEEPKKEEAKKDEPPSKEEASSEDSMLKFVPDAKGNQVIYYLDLVKSGDTIKYDVDNHKTFKKPFDRIAYYVELKTETGGLQYVYVSMDAFTDDLGKIGVPTSESKASFQQLITNMNVHSNVKGIVTGKGLKGNIEFWPNNYKEKNGKAVPNASDSVFDFGDEISKEMGYGSMQVHNYEAKQTIFAFNAWRDGKNADLGLGNSTGKSLDWTFTKNTSSYTVKRIKILVHAK